METISSNADEEIPMDVCDRYNIITKNITRFKDHFGIQQIYYSK